MPRAVPEECLWLIVSYLRHDRPTLHALLLTSTALFRIAVSFLYASPFRLLHDEANCAWSSVQLTKRYDSLVHILLHSSQLLQDAHPPQGHGADADADSTAIVSRLPRYGPEVLPLPTPSTVDYLSFYTDMFHDPMLHQTFMTLFPTVPNCYLANVIWFRPMVEIRNRIELAIMDRVLPQVTSLVINMPIMVPRIKIPWMANLQRLEILGTEFCLLQEQDLESDVAFYTESTRSNDSTHHNSHGGMSRLDKMLTFIWDHQRLFGTLRQLKIEHDVPTHVSTGFQPHHRLVELVEAMGDRLEVLDVQHWPEAVRFLDRFPITHLKSLLLPLNKEAIFEESGDAARFLWHCPRLEELGIYTQEEDLLRAWRPTEQIMDMHHDRWDRRARSQIKRISIAGSAQKVIEIINEAAELFPSSLETIAARSWFSGKLSTVPLSWSSSSLGSSQSLNRLTELDLEGEVAWTFDFASLQNSPRLCRLRLAFTGPMPSRSVKKRPAIEHVAKVFTLQDVELVGNWETLAIRKWPAVLAQTYHLQRLDLVGCEGISAEQVFSLVRDIIGQSAEWRRREGEKQVPLAGLRSGPSEGDTAASTRSVLDEYLYGHCRLRWVIVSKRLHDHLLRQWNDWKQWLAIPTARVGTWPPVAPTALVARRAEREKPPVDKETMALGDSAYVRASVARIHFSFVVTARPSSR
ncbi:hypothetical protein BGZ99_002322 [Dissophora globulifera]|uniref:Uncharacterized protein n=1 Tax=Dissophora globulifera TaxID=979702 RepID=A0A9P6UXC5_9FUNG|nr:hypothetical protein BGZ99_002322 [Dissophora globulifera]